MKKLLAVILFSLLMVGVVNAEGKVKVYMFEAGGCPYCEAQEEYLKGLSGYNKTFELIKKELYVDHVEWKQGKDYSLGKKVAEAFNEAGFEDASYEGTPFVVISDLYAAATYSTDLEEFINAAYEEGDKDAVSCIKDGGTDCIRANVVPTEPSKTSNSKAGVVVAIVGGVLLIGVGIYVFKTHNNEPVSEEVKEEKEEVKEVVKEEVKKEKPTTVKKTTKKTVSKKNTTRKPTTKKTNK